MDDDMCFEKNYDPIDLRRSWFCLWDKITVKYSREKTTWIQRWRFKRKQHGRAKHFRIDNYIIYTLLWLEICISLPPSKRLTKKESEIFVTTTLSLNTTQAIIVLSRNYFCDAFIASYLNDHKPGGFSAMNICLVNKIFKYLSINI